MKIYILFCWRCMLLNIYQMMKQDCKWCTLWCTTQTLQRHSLILKICCFMVHTRMKFMDAHNRSMVFLAVILMTHKCCVIMCMCSIGIHTLLIPVCVLFECLVSCCSWSAYDWKRFVITEFASFHMKVYQWCYIGVILYLFARIKYITLHIYHI